MKIKSFKEYNETNEINEDDINEIIVKDLPLKSIKNELPSLDTMEPVYTGNTYTLYKPINDNTRDNNYFIITDKSNTILFYQKYIKLTEFGSRTVQYYQLLARENISDTKRLFEKLIYSLLFLGYPLKDDMQHNLLSLRGITSMFWNNKIRVAYNIPNSKKLIYIDEVSELEKVLHTNDKNIGIYYQNYQLTTDDLLEGYTIKNYQSMWQGLDLFDDIEDYIG